MVAVELFGEKIGGLLLAKKDLVLKLDVDLPLSWILVLNASLTVESQQSVVSNDHINLLTNKSPATRRTHEEGIRVPLILHQKR